MSSKTGIEWTDATWNPLVGCTAVSPGCDHCYAARDASGRLSGVPVYEGLAVDGVFTGEVRELPERLDKPLHWQKPRRIFVNSMSDLFHPSVSMVFIAEVWAVMAIAEQHQFQVLTKRPQRMRAVLSNTEFHMLLGNAIDRRTGSGRMAVMKSDPIQPNVWVGTSIENDAYSFRADHLRNTPAAVKFLSCEPLIGGLPSLDVAGMDWVIVGGESGPAARPMHPDWARHIRKLCRRSHIPFLFKQWGEWVPPDQIDALGWDDVMMDERGVSMLPDGRQFRTFGASSDDDYLAATQMWHTGRKAAGRMLDGRTWDEYPGG